MHLARIAAAICLLTALAACGGGSSSAPPAPANVAPVALAGAAQTVKYGATVTLDGSGSSDANGDTLTYSWTLSDKPYNSYAVLTGATSAHPVFTPDRDGSYTASLTVSDGKASSSVATVTISVAQASIYLSDGAPVTTAVGAAATLGPPSTYTGDDFVKVSYSWTFTSKPSGATATLASANAAQASLTPDLPGDYIVSVVGSDGTELSAPARTTVTALNATVFKRFVDLVNNASCNNLVNDLYLIDGKYVFADVEGSCVGASYSVGLYDLTTAQLLCSVADSATGAQRSCPDTSVQTLFDTLYANRYLSTLGHDSGRVSHFIKPPPLPAGATAVGFNVITHRPLSLSGVSGLDGTTAVARDDAEWAVMWQRYFDCCKSGNAAAPAPPSIDFSKQTVLALYYLQVSSCRRTQVTNAYILDSQVVVEYVSMATWSGGVPCSSITYSAEQLFTIDIPAASTLSIVFKGSSN